MTVSDVPRQKGGPAQGEKQAGTEYLGQRLLVCGIAFILVCQLLGVLLKIITTEAGVGFGNFAGNGFDHVVNHDFTRDSQGTGDCVSIGGAVGLKYVAIEAKQGCPGVLVGIELALHVAIG